MDGYVSALIPFAEKGEFGTAVNSNGSVYIANGQVYVFGAKGNQKKVINIPERPATITFGGRDNKTLYVTGANSMYSVTVE